MTSQLDSETIKILTLHNISRSKNNHTVRFGEVIEYNKINVFLQKSCRSEASRLVPDFIFLKINLNEVKAGALQHSFNTSQ